MIEVKMLEFVQATRDDVLSIYPQLPQGDPVELSCGRESFEKDLVPLDGTAVAIREGGRCIGAYGIVGMWPGVARVWALFSEGLLKDHPILLGVHIRRDLKRAEQFGFHRIEATASVAHISGAVFLAWLGFHQEGLMRRYTPSGTSMYLYAKVCDVI